ncbi:MAG: T9SS type A sorting domain-containing protein [Bacteroidales bacterium]|nr:T9SS type A sorting domain-containing protein [Bacteroidales bacterium]
MKRVLLLSLAVLLAFAGYTQKRASISKALKDVSVTREYTQPVDGSEMSQALNYVPLKQSTLLEEQQIGVTRYDLQSNSALSNRIYMFDDGTMAATWTYGMDDVGNWSDRGSAHNYYDGSVWGPLPTSKIETQKSGWPSIAPLGEDGEIVISHNAVDALIVNRRDTKGTGAWNETILQGPPGNEKVTWPRIVTSGVNNEIVHCLGHIRDSYGGMGTPLGYWRSLDGGDTWETEYLILDEIGPNFYLEHSADEVIWAEPRAGNIAFCLTDTWHDFVLMKSDDDGDNWTKTIIWEHPYPFFDWNVTITTDTLWAPDGSAGMAMDNSGKVHVVIGLGRVAHFEVGTTYQYWPYSDGIAYWNEDMPPFTAPDQHDALDAWDVLVEDVNLVGWTQDIDNNGMIDILPDIMSYRELGISTMANIIVDPEDRIFVVFASTTEGYDNGTYNFKHIWARGSKDGGATWLDFTDFTADLIHIFDECVYPIVALNSDDYIHLFYNVDTEPGLFLDDDHAAVDNRQIYVRELKDSIVGPVGIRENFVLANSNVSQNYPNPASGITYVNVDLSAPADLRLEVYNLIGEKVLQIEKGQVNAGLHRFNISVSGLKPGMYLYTVFANGSEITHKMLVE